MKKYSIFLDNLGKLDDYLIRCEKEVKDAWIKALNENPDLELRHTLHTTWIKHHARFHVLLSLLKSPEAAKGILHQFPYAVSLEHHCFPVERDYFRKYFNSFELESLIEDCNSSYEFSESAKDWKKNDVFIYNVNRKFVSRPDNKKEEVEWREDTRIFKNVFDNDIDNSSISFHRIGYPIDTQLTDRWTLEYIDNKTKEKTVLVDLLNNPGFSLKELFKNILEKQ